MSPLFTWMGLLGAAMIASAAIAAGPDDAERQIRIIVPWGAGGGTDATARILARLMKERLDVPVGVVNQPQRASAAGHAAIAAAKPDGHTLGVLTSDSGILRRQGLIDRGHESFTLLALYNADAAAVHVRANAPFRNLRELLNALNGEPARYRASGGSTGGIWHLALGRLLEKAGLSSDALAWVPRSGVAPAFADLIAGRVDVVICSLAEAQVFREAGLVRSLAVLDEARSAEFPDVPTVRQAAGLDVTFFAWRGLVAPAGLPEKVIERLVPALEEIHGSREFRDFMMKRGFGVVWKSPTAFREFLTESDVDVGAAMAYLGLDR